MSTSTIYTKDAEQTLVLGTRNYLFRPFDVGDWTTITIGMFVRAVSAEGDDTLSSTESVPSSATPIELTCIGIKNADNEILPGLSGSRFIGIGNVDNGISTCSTTALGMQAHGGEVSVMALSGAEPLSGSSGYAAFTTAAWDANPLATTYCGFIGLRLTINDKDTTYQSMSASVSTDQNAPLPYDEINLMSHMASATYAAAGNRTWNDNNTAALAIPDALFIKLPFSYNRFRFSCIAIVKSA